MHRGSLSIDRGINAIYRFIRFFLLYCNFLPTGSREEPKILKNLLSQGMPGLEESDERNRWLCEKCLTFSTVQEAIVFLEGERKKKS